MDLFTLDRNYLKRDLIDGFNSIIWTERYYGDSEVELVVPSTPEMKQILYEGIFLGLSGSTEIMIVETANDEEGNLKLSGIALLPWMNNRFIRTSNKHDEKTWTYAALSPGHALWAIIYYMCVEGSPYLNGSINTGISNPQRLAIPKLGLLDYDKSGVATTFNIPYGPVYDAMREIATGYEIGMQIVLTGPSSSPTLGFRSYKGLDRTSGQSARAQVRFSAQMDSLANIKELRSIAALKTLAFAFASNLDAASGLNAGAPGSSSRTGSQYTGFDLRALQILADDITKDSVGGNAATLLNVLNTRAAYELGNNRYITAVDGEIVPTNQFKYGVHYNLGDVIEVQGSSGIVQTSRVTEYIRAQDEAGERAYPTVAALS